MSADDYGFSGRRNKVKDKRKNRKKHPYRQGGKERLREEK